MIFSKSEEPHVKDSLHQDPIVDHIQTSCRFRPIGLYESPKPSLRALHYAKTQPEFTFILHGLLHGMKFAQIFEICSISQINYLSFRAEHLI